jgi:parvulin-like peptidyl-prolyl isomerase
MVPGGGKPVKRSRLMWIKAGFILGLGLAVLSNGCGSDKKSSEGADSKDRAAVQKQKEPDVVAVQHVLIAFEGTVPGKAVTRTREEAQKLAEEILEKARSGEDFGALVKQYTDDSYPGIYRMANFGVAADLSQGVYSRGGMVPAFGNVGFSLDVGEVGMAAYSQEESPFGWHIIKRVE